MYQEDNYEESIFSIGCETYNKLYTVNKIINKKSAEYFLWVKFPKKLPPDFVVSNLKQIQKSEGCVGDCCEQCAKENTIPRDMYCRDGSQYLRVTFPALDNSNGKHIYVMDVVTPLGDMIKYYFSYVIQNDDPDQPYIYPKCTTTEDTTSSSNSTDPEVNLI